MCTEPCWRWQKRLSHTATCPRSSMNWPAGFIKWGALITSLCIYTRPRATLGADDGSPTSGHTLADAEREHILNVVRETGWVLGGPKGAAARLGMKRSTLRWKMKGSASPGRV